MLLSGIGDSDIEISSISLDTASHQVCTATSLVMENNLFGCCWSAILMNILSVCEILIFILVILNLKGFVSNMSNMELYYFNFWDPIYLKQFYVTLMKA